MTGRFIARLDDKGMSVLSQSLESLESYRLPGLLGWALGGAVSVAGRFSCRLGGKSCPALGGAAYVAERFIGRQAGSAVAGRFTPPHFGRQGQTCGVGSSVASVAGHFIGGLAERFKTLMELGMNFLAGGPAGSSCRRGGRVV